MCCSVHKATKGPEELSGGEQQRLMIARTLAYAPDIYVLDEPLVGLDAVVKENLLALLRERADAGASVLVSSHELDILASEMNALTLLDEGCVVFDGTQQDFLTYFVPEDTVTFTLSESVDAELSRLLGDSKHDVDGNSLKVRVGSDESIGDLVSLVAARAEILDLKRTSPTLNDAVRAAYDRPAQEGKGDLQ